MMSIRLRQPAPGFQLRIRSRLVLCRHVLATPSGFRCASPEIVVIDSVEDTMSSVGTVGKPGRTRVGTRVGTGVGLKASIVGTRVVIKSSSPLPAAGAVKLLYGVVGTYLSVPSSVCPASPTAGAVMGVVSVPKSTSPSNWVEAMMW